MIAKYSPVLEPCDRMLGTSPASAVRTPRAVADDATSSKAGSDELADAAITAVGKHTSMTASQTLDVRVAVRDRIVPIAGSATGDRNDAEVRATDEDLSVARPAVVLGLGRGAVIAGRNERPVDNPRPTSIEIDTVVEKRSEPRDDVDDDAMGLRARNREHGCQLAHGEIRAQARATDLDASLELAPMDGRASRDDEDGARCQRSGMEAGR